MPRRRSDPVARQAVLGIAAGRIAIGVGALVATRPALRVLGFTEADARVESLGRIAGGRDIAIGLLAVAAHGDERSLRRAVLAGAAVDATDAIVFGSLAAADPDARRAGVVGAASGAAAAIVGTWAWRRLGGGS